jgi:putative ABC transport system permease protein
MITNYFKTAYRNLSRRKLFSFINIFGLALGLAFCSLIGIYIYDNWRVDKTQPQNLYRVITSYTSKNQGDAELATVGRALVHTIEQEVAEVKTVTPVRASSFTVTYKNEHFYDKVLYAGEHFLTAFNFPVISGNASDALQQPYSAVITENIAKKYFGNANIVGETLYFNDTIPCKVTAVIKNPEPSHIGFDILLSFSTFTSRQGDMSQWFTWDTNCYVQLKDNASAAMAEKQIAALSMLHNKDEYDNVGYNVKHKLEPVRDIYLHSKLGGINTITGKSRQLVIFGIIGLALLILACINFINLTTAYQAERIKEVGIRKTIGASVGSLQLHFITETFVMVIVAAIVAAGLMVLLLPYVSTIAEKQLSLALFLQPAVALGVAVLLIVTTLLSGWYPALLLSRLRPVQSFRIQSGVNKSGVSLRKVLVVFQFTISIILITGTVIASGQLKFMERQPLGFTKEEVLVVPLKKLPYKNFVDNYESIRQQMVQIPGIKTVTSAAAMPGRTGWGGQIVIPEGFTEQNSLTMEVIPVDHYYAKTLGITMKSGRDYSPDFATDKSNGVLLNETACRLIGWTPEEAVNKKVQTAGMNEGKVIGVMKDYHQHGLQQKVGPVLTFINPGAYNFMAMRLDTKDIAQTIASAGSFWKKNFPGYPFEYFMMDEDFNRQYKSERNLAGVITLFSLLTIFVACLGLFGLTAYITSQRKKEIGIRKVLGASIANIVGMISNSFVKLVLIATLLATPAAWYIMNKWLQDFAYRIEISGWTFVLAGISGVTIALITVSFQTIKAAIANPVKSLRTE